MNDESFVLSQSKYYTPALNGAIFDGPFRIYFTQSQESEALKIYFYLQNELEDLFDEAKDKVKDNNIYIMLYPNSEVFERSFDVEPFYAELAMEHLSDECIMGLHGDVSPNKLKYLTLRVKSILENWECAVPDKPLEFPHKTVLEV